ncbi:MAG TPA: alpha/beta fold hydrolase [Acidisarcina sp.]|nr:alpha/beta fold hydrolase [Acidisarcina sp.]
MNRFLSFFFLSVPVLFLGFLALDSFAQTAPPARPFTVAEIYSESGLTGKAPEGQLWSPDGARLTYVSEEGDLMQVEAATGRVSVLVGRNKLASLISANAPEKDKDHRSRYNMPGYIWAPDSRHLLFDSNGQLWLYDLHIGTGVQVAFSGIASGDDPKFSPDGSMLSFVRDHNLYICQLRKAGTPTASVSNNRDPNVFNGQVDWLYLEELGVRSNYFWSPDSRQVAYLEMNEGAVPEYPLVDWIPTHAQVDLQRYPQPGDNNPAVRVGVVGGGGGKTVWMKLPFHEGQDYIPRFGWATRKTLWIETISRDHTHRNLYFADAATGNTTLALALKDDKYFDESYDITFSGIHIALTSWQDGHSHIYLYSFDAANPTTAKLEAQLTKGDFEVSSIAGLDESHHTVYFASNEGDARQQQVWAVQMDGSDKRKVSQTAGFHDPELAPEAAFYADTYSSQMTPTTVSLCTSKGACKPFWQSKSLSGYSLTAPENLETKASDGTTLYGSLLLPPGRTATASVPLIINPYGGPHAQTVRDAWSKGFLFDQLLVQHGYAVLHVDNRGMGSRGRSFEQAAYHNFGPVQLEDQFRALDDALARYPQLDRNRVGWWGWSWGGTFTLYAMTHSSRVVAGVAVAPVTDWHNYDSTYTERYLGTPASNPDSYHDFSVVNEAQNLKGRLLLVHGTGDDNVHVGNSIQFLQHLIDADIPYDLQLYPRKTHSIAGEESRTHLFERILAHFDRYLMNAHQNATTAGTNSGEAE